MDHWRWRPVGFCRDALGLELEPWACDILDALMLDDIDRVAFKACHGVGKTTLMAAEIIHYTVTRQPCRNPSTAPTYAKQVRDVLWTEIAHWWANVKERVPALWEAFELQTTRLQNRSDRDWYAVGIPSSIAINMEGYHSRHVLICFDEAKGIKPRVFEAVHGMRTTEEVKWLVGSTPGGTTGEFHRVFTESELRKTWKMVVSVHAAETREELAGRLDLPAPRTRDEDGRMLARLAVEDGRQRVVTADEFRAGAYFSNRPKRGWAASLKTEWGPDNSAYVARVLGLFPYGAGDELYEWPWIARAEDLDEGVEGPTWVAIDVARYGRDRTVLLVLKGGTVVHGETIGKAWEETTSAEARAIGVGPDPRHPRYRDTDIVADAGQRLRRQYDAVGIVVDRGAMGGGVESDLRRRGETVEGVDFGASPTYRRKLTEEQAAALRKRGQVDEHANFKAEMAWHLRDLLEAGHVALGPLESRYLKPLKDQLSMVKKDYDPSGRKKVVDPDETEDPMGISEEGKKSPDHFHALMIGTWKTCPKITQKPAAGAAHLPPGVGRVGEPARGGGKRMAGQVAATAAGWVGGQAAYVTRMYR